MYILLNPLVGGLFLALVVDVYRNGGVVAFILLAIMVLLCKRMETHVLEYALDHMRVHLVRLHSTSGKEVVSVSELRIMLSEAMSAHGSVLSVLDKTRQKLGEARSELHDNASHMQTTAELRKINDDLIQRLLSAEEINDSNQRLRLENETIRAESRKSSALVTQLRTKLLRSGTTAVSLEKEKRAFKLNAAKEISALHLVRLNDAKIKGETIEKVITLIQRLTDAVSLVNLLKAEKAELHKDLLLLRKPVAAYRRDVKQEEEKLERLRWEEEQSKQRMEQAMDAWKLKLLNTPSDAHTEALIKAVAEKESFRQLYEEASKQIASHSLPAASLHAENRALAKEIETLKANIAFTGGWNHAKFAAFEKERQSAEEEVANLKADAASLRAKLVAVGEIKQKTQITREKHDFLISEKQKLVKELGDVKYDLDRAKVDFKTANAWGGKVAEENRRLEERVTGLVKEVERMSASKPDSRLPIDTPEGLTSFIRDVEHALTVFWSDVQGSFLPSPMASREGVADADCEFCDNSDGGEEHNP